MKLKLIVILTFGSSLQDWVNNGLFSREILLYEELEKKGIETQLISFSKNDENYLLKNYKSISSYSFYEKNKKYKSSILNFIYSFFIAFKIRNDLCEFDLIKTNQLMGSWIGVILKFLSNKPLYIRTGYDIYTFSIFEGKSFFKIFFYKQLTKFSLFFSNIYTVSSKVDQYFFKNTYNKKQYQKVKLHQNWVSVPDSNPPIESRKNEIIMVGRLEEQKNYHNVLKYFKNQEIKLNIYGEGSKEKELKKYCAENKINVNFNKNIPNNLLFDEYRKYKYYLNYSTYEGNSKSILEAMANGCVVLSSNNQNNLELVEGVGIIVNLENSNNFYHLVEKVNNQKLSNLAYNKIKNNFSLNKYIERELFIYNSLVL